MKTKTAYRRPKPQAEIPQPHRPMNGELQHEPEFKPDAPIQAEPKTDIPVLDQRPPEPEESEATKRLKQQLADLERSGELDRQRQTQAAQIDRANQLFNIWRQEGLDDDGAQFLITAGPQLISELTEFASREALGQGHKINTPEYADALRKGFHTHLRHLQEQARAAEQHSEPSLDNHPTAEAAMPLIPPAPPLLDPLPALRQQEHGRRSAIVSAPVSRELPGNYRHDPQDPSKITLTAQQVEAANIAGITPAEYARQLIRMKKAQANGEIQG
jgi:hypothetical protein